VHGKSRLDLLRSALPELIETIDTSLAEDELLPKWSEDDLRQVVPDADVRHRLLTGLHPQPKACQLEPIPVFAGWPYLQLDGEHFHLLVDPAAVAEALLQLASGLLQ
jgi:hypothetical protein